MDRSKSDLASRMGLLAAAALVTALTQTAQAGESHGASLKSPDVSYLTGGVTRDDEQHMHDIAKAWPLRMEFSERKDNEFVTGVHLQVADLHGRAVLALADTGPMTFARLPPGTYRVTADFHGKPETRLLTLDGRDGRDLYFHWMGNYKHDPYDGSPVGGLEVPG